MKPRTPVLSCLVIDTREPAMLRALVANTCKEAAWVSFTALDSADYVIQDKCGHTLAWERKKLSDLCASVKDGRLFRQVEKMREAYTVPGLLVEGIPRYVDKTTARPVGSNRALHLPYMAIQGALLSVQKERLVLLHTAGIEDTARTLEWLCRKGAKGCLVA